MEDVPSKFTLRKKTLLNLGLAALVPMFSSGGFEITRSCKYAGLFPLCGITIAVMLIFSERLPFEVRTPAISSATKVTRFFNSTYIINNAIRELEADGWIAPKKGLFERLKKMEVASPPTTVSSFANPENTEPVLLKADRWKGETVVRFIYQMGRVSWNLT